MANTKAIKRGWHYDIVNSRLQAYADGIEFIRTTLSSDAMDVRLFGDTPADNYFDFDASYPRFKITSGTAGAGRLEVHQGDLKIHNHSVSSGYVSEFKIEFTNTTGTLYGNHRTTIMTSVFTGTGNSMIGTFNNFYIGATYSITSASASYFATVGNSFLNQGTLNGAGINCGCTWSLIDDGGTWTAISALRNLWLDTHLAQTISAGVFYMLDITVNGTTQPDALIHTSSGSSTNPILHLAGNNGAAVSTDGTPGAVTGATGWIKVAINGSTRYIPLATSVS